MYNIGKIHTKSNLYKTKYGDKIIKGIQENITRNIENYTEKKLIKEIGKRGKTIMNTEIIKKNIVDNMKKKNVKVT